MISCFFGKPRRSSFVAALNILAVLFVFMMLSITQAAAYDLSTFNNKYTLQEIMPGAERLDPESGPPPSAAAYRGDELLGYVYLNSTAVNATGYSGKPIHIVVGMDLNGIITGLKMVKHSEPIVLIGIPEKEITDFNNKL